MPGSASPVDRIIEAQLSLESVLTKGKVDPFLATASVVVGLTLGSFLNVCIYRLPRDMSVMNPRWSACPNCKHQIAFYDNIPVLSWMILRGRCRNCKSSISPRYVLIEILTALLFLACSWHFGMTLATLKYCTLAFLLLGLIFTDAETKLLPDTMTLTGLALGIGFSLFVPVNDLAAQFLPGVVYLPMSSDLSSHLLSLADSLLGATVGASFLYGAGAIYLRARGVEGMGFGDVKLMTMIGSFLGVKLTVLTIFAASLAGSIFGVSTILIVWIKRTHRFIERRHLTLHDARRRAWVSAQTVYRHYEMPFGVFLGSMAMLAFFFGKQFLDWYWRLL